MVHQKERQHPLIIKKNVFYLLLAFIAFIFFVQLIGINVNNPTGNPVYQIDPLRNAGSFFGSDITLFNGTPVPFWGLILTFAMIFSVVFVLVKKIHIFKNEDNVWPAVIFSLGLSFLTIFATDITSLIVALAATLTYFVIIAAIILVGWAAYLGVHKSISEGVGEISQIASTRIANRAAVKEVKGAYFQTATGYDTAKKEYKVLKSLKKEVYGKDKQVIENLLRSFDNLNSREFIVNENINKIMGRIERNLDPSKKGSVFPLVEDINTLQQEFADKIKEIRNQIERIKASIKANDFISAERDINKALEFEQDLEKISKNIAKKEMEINRVLLKP